MDPLLIFAALCAGLAAGSVALGLQTSLFSTERAVRARTVDEWHRAGAKATSAAPSTARIRLPLTASTEVLELQLRQADWAIRTSEYMFLRLVCAGVFAVAGFIFAGMVVDNVWVRVIAAVVGVVIGQGLPGSHLKSRREARLHAVEDALPVTLSGIAKALQSGSGLLQALDHAAATTDKPLGPELQLTMRDLQLGGDPQAVFSDLIRRVPSHDLEIAATAIMIQRTVGGNLSDILEHVASTIRERHDIQSEVKVLTSQQRVTGYCVAVLPIAIAVIFFFLNPTVARLLFDEPAGRISLAVGIGFEVLGIWMIRRFAIIEV